jgi:hypothetical protein
MSLLSARRLFRVISALLCAALATTACAGPKFSSEEACEGSSCGAGGDAGQVTSTSGSGGGSGSGGNGGKGGSSGSGGSASGGTSGVGGDTAGGGAAGNGGSSGTAGERAGQGGGSGSGGVAAAGGVAGALGAGAGGSAGLSAGSAGVAGTGGSMGGDAGAAGADPIGFPATGVLDDFENAEGFGERWMGATQSFSVEGGVLTCVDCPYAALHAEELKSDQEVFVTLAAFSVASDEVNLVLLAQHEGCDLIEILYSPAGERLEVLTCGPAGWQGHGSTELRLEIGDRFGARLRADGRLQVFVNEVERLLVELGPLPAETGHIGVSGITLEPLAFDDFGGGQWR